MPEFQVDMNTKALDLAVLKGSQETHIVDEKNKLEEQLDNQKNILKDYNQKIDDLEKKQNLAEDIFTIAKNPVKFIDPSVDSMSSEDFQKKINELTLKRRKETTLMNRFKIQLAKIKNLVPKNSQDN